MARQTSDISRSRKGNRISRVARKVEYSDLDLTLKLHPHRKDITPLRDDNAVRNALKNLVMTNFFERPFQPSLGANLRGLLFEPADTMTQLAMKDNIERCVQEEPRVKLLDTIITDLAERNAYRITLKYLIKENNRQEDVEIVLRRLR
tara:strand:- start:3477 stop:3920 length:444 start_codon:yes stop_codon:yes gene_type:complete